MAQQKLFDDLIVCKQMTDIKLKRYIPINYAALLAEAVEFTYDLWIGVRSCLNECPIYVTKQSDHEALVMELWEKWSTPS